MYTDCKKSKYPPKRPLSPSKIKYPTKTNPRSPPQPYHPQQSKSKIPPIPKHLKNTQFYLGKQQQNPIKIKNQIPPHKNQPHYVNLYNTPPKQQQTLTKTIGKHHLPSSQTPSPYKVNHTYLLPKPKNNNKSLSSPCPGVFSTKQNPIWGYQKPTATLKNSS